MNTEPCTIIKMLLRALIQYIEDKEQASRSALRSNKRKSRAKPTPPAT